MLSYLLKLIACSGLFYAFYFFFLQKEKMLVFNRVYLLGALVLSFIIPLICFKVEMPAPDYETVAFNYTVASSQKPELSLLDILQQLSLIIWMAVGCFLLIRLLRNLWMIYHKSRGADLHRNPRATIVLIDTPIIPHSFFNCIFLSKTAFENNQIDEAIIQHEMAHVKQLHSLDILLIETIQCFLWFNPFVYLYKQSIKLNHEYLADNAATIGRADNLSYQQLLLKSVYVNNNIPLASSFYFFTTKKRLLMLQKKRNKKRSRLLIAAASVLAIVGVAAFSSREIIYAEKEQPAKVLQDAAAVTSGSLPVDTVPVKSKSLTGATTEEINEYKRLEKALRVEEADGKRAYKYDEEKTHQALNLYLKMTEAQRKTVPEMPPPPPPAPPPVMTPAATDGEIKTYEGLLDKLGRMQAGTDRYNNLMKQTRAIYGKMTEEQRKTARPLHPLPPPPPNAPQSVTVTDIPPPAAYSAPADVASIAISANSAKKEKVVEVSYKDGRKIKEDISTKEKEQAFEKKYGIKLPKPPHPPSKPTQS